MELESKDAEVVNVFYSSNDNIADDLPGDDYDGDPGEHDLFIFKQLDLRTNSHSEHSYDQNIGNMMWTMSYIGLYSQYAAVGLLYGTSGVALNFCVYAYKGQSNLCANAKSMVTLAWSFKIFYAIFTDSIRPWGMRRKPFMYAGWLCTLLLLLVLAVTANSIDASSWIGMNMVMQAFIMLADVPADGYSVELGQLESPEKRGQILATGQIIRFSFSILAGAIQTFLVNGPTTNDPNCKIRWDHCWQFGLTMLVLVSPILFLKELDGSHIPLRTLREFMEEIWDTMQNLTTLSLMIYVVGIMAFGQLTNNASTYIQYYVINLTNFQAGIDTMTSYGALVFAIWIFKTYLIRKNWRLTTYLSCIITSVLGLLWVPVFYDTGGLRNAWFTIFIDLDQAFTAGLSQVLFSMAVIELAKPGQEATTYELVISVANAAITLAGVISTQLLHPVHANGCTAEPCGSDTVNLKSVEQYEATDGPRRFSYYTVLLIGVSIGATLLFAQFLPRSKEQCHEWRAIGEHTGNRFIRGILGLCLALAIVLYGILASVLLLDSKTSCLPEIGGSGC
eukprot:gene2110-4125_t